MSTPLSYNEALHKAAALCSRREQCSEHIRNKLYEWGLEGYDVEKIIRYLTEQHFIDDARYCKSFVHDKIYFDKWGRIKIKYALVQKKIDSSIIEEVFSGINEEDYRTTLTNLLKAKAKSLKGQQDYAAEIKLLRYAASRGFESHLIKQCLPWKAVDYD